MLRSRRAGTKLLRAAIAMTAIGVPAALTSNAAAGGDSVSIYYGSAPSRASVGKLMLDGRCFVIGEQCFAEREIAQIFCQMGYSASYDGSRIVIYTSSCHRPQFGWESCDFNLESSWRGDCLVLCLRAICHTAPRVVYTPPRIYNNYYRVAPRSSCDTGFGISFNFGSDRGWNWGNDHGRSNDRDQRHYSNDRDRSRLSNERDQRSFAPPPDRGVQVVDRRRTPSPYPVAPPRGGGGHDDTRRATRRP